MVVQVNSIYDLAAIDISQQSEVGEKAIALSQLLQKGFPVLPGIVVSPQLFVSLFWEENRFLGVSPFHLNFSDYQLLQKISEDLTKKVANVTLDPKWCEEIWQQVSVWKTPHLILRPSPIFSDHQASGLWESQFCSCNQEDIITGLKQVWQSLFRAQSLFYCQQKGIKWEELGLAIIIQPAYSAIASGTFQAQPKTWEIEAVKGLGQSLVRGEVLPECYTINPKTHAVKNHQLGNQTRLYDLDSQLQVKFLQEAEKKILTSEQLLHLISLGANLKTTTQQKFSYEWILIRHRSKQEQENDFKLYLTQFTVESSLSKPMTVSKSSTSPVILKGIGAAKGKATGEVYLFGTDDQKSFPKGGILVVDQITTESLALINSAGGLITEAGGMTSHGAILARELNIPAVVGAKGAIQTLQGKETVMIDGDKGEVSYPSHEETPIVEPPLFAEKKNSVLGTQLMVNVSQNHRATELANLPVDGVGLLRSELMLLPLLQERSLSSWLSPSHRDDFIHKLAELIGQFAHAFFPRPVFYRSTDWLTVQEGENSVFGDRGTYSYVKNSDFFSAQMFALRHLKHQGDCNINLILPFVREVEEVKFCKTLLNQMNLDCEVWIMAEVPSVVYLLEAYIKAGIQGIAIGTNDLTQLLFGVDREQGEFRQQFNECHPAMLKLLKNLIQTARNGGIGCSICGQGVSLYSELIDHLVRWGISSISVEESAVEKVYDLIARSEKRILLDAARKQINFDHPTNSP
ncbi:MAG: putative PEP-binding protein [Chroococcales cyanobacterium]